ncbi:MAG: cation-transporting ATPase [Naasia sp.]
MSKLNRFISIASKALEKAGESSSRQSGSGSLSGSGQTDWRDLVRSTADRLTGDTRSPDSPPRQTAPAASAPASPTDRAAIARYDYLLQTAEPGQLEQVHRDAFERLTPEQREQVAARLRAELPANEQPISSTPEQLARTATRGEAREPGFLKKVFSSSVGRTAGAAGVGAVAGVGIGAAGGLLAAVAGGAVISSVAAPLLAQAAGMGVDFSDYAGGVEEFTGGAGEFLSSAGDEVSGFGEGFEIPGFDGFGGLFDR